VSAVTAHREREVVMFQGSMIDVGIGVILLFLVASLLASAVVETVGGFFHRRSKNLWDTIDLMLGKAKPGDGDEARLLVDTIYRQPFVTKLVQPKAQPFYPTNGASNKPSPGAFRSYASGLDGGERKRRFHGPQHIDAKDFANAFIAAVAPGGGADVTIAALTHAIEPLPDTVKQPLGAVLARAGNDVLAARTAVETWYADHMRAVSVWYRRQTRYFLFCAGLVLAVIGNLDAIGLTRTLYRDKAVREAVVAEARTIEASTSTCRASGTAAAQVSCVRNDLGGAVGLPVGWGGIDRTAGAWALRLFGWILVAGAVTLGAPFWFDLLGRALAHRKGDDGG
jgi:hypothetical protein